jgi:hypothetical protein
VICEILRFHIDRSVLNENDQIDAKKIDLVARMGDNWYCRANEDSIFEVQKPITTIGIGIDQIPEEIRNSTVLTGNNLGLLASVEQIPNDAESLEYKKSIKAFADRVQAHQFAKTLLEANKVKEAWMVLL